MNVFISDVVVGEEGAEKIMKMFLTMHIAHLGARVKIVEKIKFNHRCRRWLAQLAL
jgi:hypothetical protein